MDTSKEYIKMRIAAMPDMGRGVPLESTFRSDNYYVLENEEYSVFISTIGDWYTFNPVIEMSKQGRTCQLERQDQLQEMIINFGHGHSNGGILAGLSMFSHEYGYDEKSMEQLWLGFLMQEKYHKIWDGKEWVSGE